MLGGVSSAVDVVGKLQSLQRQQTELSALQNNLALDVFRNLPDNPTDEQIRNAVPDAARVAGPGGEQHVLSYKNQLLGVRGKERQKVLDVLRLRGLTPMEGLTERTGPADAYGRPRIGTVRNVPGWMSEGDAGGGGAGGGTEGPPGPRGYVRSLPPGEEGTMQAAAARAADLEGSAQETENYGTLIGQLGRLSDSMKKGGAPFGPTAEFESNLNTFLKRVNPNFGYVHADSLRDMNEFNKIVNLLASSGARFGSNFALSHSIHSNPSLLQTPEGREAIINQLQGLNDWRKGLREEWMRARKAGAAAADFNSWQNDRMPAQSMFMFNRMTPQAQLEYLKSIPKPEREKFRAAYEGSARRFGFSEPKF